MDIARAPNTAVLMGDIVNSRDRHTPARLHALFNDAVAAANQNNGADILSPLTITLGDEFQGITTSLTTAATIARQLRLDLLQSGIDCRFVIGQLRLQTPINTSIAWNMMGEGLARARSKLNDKQTGLFYRVALFDDPTHEILFDALCLSLSTIEEDWTDIQAQTVAQTLAGSSVEDIATRRAVTSRNVYKTLKSAKLDVYTTLWTALLTGFTKIEEP
ncbi:SatD family protein [Devosia sp. MC521]|uniref:SatD family protein n=1 Tax=Devosia sp. MC521 TaxID=2759954 RepID=UPI0015FB9EA2|nr:SatD family protein [Devosia sp. MC521]MBJ6986746.1 hypothetical protein [Devosia sp. MC521]QMW61778.1 hypothetical protein H4N61_12505 [Devosia sp. MC521]